jgi:hypothetical protein
MGTVRLGTLRHPKFDASAKAIAAGGATDEAAINGAIWEIEHAPKAHGFYEETLDIWYAKLLLPSRKQVMLYYSISPRFVMMLAIREI